MKEISSSIALGILLVSLLGLLGCSDSDAGTAAVPGETNPVAPFGIIDTMDPKYEWTPVSGATKYRLLVQDADDAVVVDEWYTAEESGCASEEVSCTVHPGIITTGENTWKVQACTNQECGLWSEPLHYDMRPSTVSEDDHYVDTGHGTVVDYNTGLMWGFRTMCADSQWADAISCCEGSTYANHDDWYLPSLAELSSLNHTVNCGNACSLSIYHPIYGWGSRYWTSTRPAHLTDNDGYAYAVYFGICSYTLVRDVMHLPVRCVRNNTHEILPLTNSH